MSVCVCVCVCACACACACARAYSVPTLSSESTFFPQPKVLYCRETFVRRELITPQPHARLFLLSR